MHGYRACRHQKARTLGWEQLPPLLLYFFGNCRTESYLITAVLKSLSQPLRRTLTRPFGIHLTVEDFTDMDQHTQ